MAGERKWRGMLVPLDTVSQDGRVICSPTSGDPRTRQLPLPLMLVRKSGEPAGRVDRVWIQDGALYAEGATSLCEETRYSVGVDLDECVNDTFGPMHFTDWRLCGVTVYGPTDIVEPAFPGAYIQVTQEATDGQ